MFKMIGLRTPTINNFFIDDLLSPVPNQTTELKASFAYSKDQNYQVKLGILSPMTQEPSVHFAMKGFEGEVMPKLATIQKDQKGTDK